MKNKGKTLHRSFVGKFEKVCVVVTAILLCSVRFLYITFLLMFFTFDLVCIHLRKAMQEQKCHTFHTITRTI